MEDDFDPETQPKWLEFHNVLAGAFHEAINQICMPVEHRRRNRTDERLWAITEWCQHRLAKF